MEEKNTSGLGIGSLILGIIGMLLSCLAIGIFPCIIALVFAIIGLTNKNTKNGTCIGGLVCSVIGIGIFLIFVLLIGSSSDSDSVKKVENTSSKQIEVEKEETEPISNEKENVEVEEKEEKGFFTAGESFDAKGLVVTINELNSEFTDYDDPYGFNELEDGKKYIKASFTFENNSDSEKYVSIYDFDCYADGTTCEQHYSFGGDFINTNLSPTRNVSFDTYYIVPADCEVIELEYKINMFSDEIVLIRF